jgi:5'-3' exonuclease
MLFTSILNAQKSGDLKTPTGKLHDMNKIKPFFLHLLFNNMKYVKENFAMHDNEEMILCLDSSSWRKDYYPLYKSNRKVVREASQINWEEFYKIVNDTVEVIKNFFPFKILKVNKAEGDDLMAVLAKHYNKEERILLITEDKDMRQLLEYKNVQAYRPIKKEFLQMSKDELREWRVEHILLGDASDGVPTIKAETEFTPEFMKYLNDLGIDLPKDHTVYEFNKRSDAKELLERYDGVDKYGKNNTYKAGNFGEKSAQQFVPNILQNLKKNKLWKENFRRNRILVQFKYIPKDLEQNIIEEFNNIRKDQKDYNPEKMLEFFKENALNQLAKNIDSFCSADRQEQYTLDDWC